MQKIFRDAVNLPSRKGYYSNSISYFVPIYKLNLKSGEVELLLSEANIEVDKFKEFVFLSNSSTYKDFNNNNYCYFWAFSKKHLHKSCLNFDYFNQSYLDEILKIEPTDILKKLGYICFCFKEDLNEENYTPLFFKEKRKNMTDKDRSLFNHVYLDLGGDEYIIKNKKENEWIKAEPIIRSYTDYYFNYIKGFESPLTIFNNKEDFIYQQMLIKKIPENFSIQPYKFDTKNYTWGIVPISLKIYKLLEDRMDKMNELEKEKNKFINKVKKKVRK